MKRLLATGIFLLLALTAYSQTLVGARSGFNYSKVNGIGSANQTFNWKNGYHVGIFLISNIGDKIYVQPELVFSTKGYNYSKQYSKDRVISGDTLNLNQSAKLNYLDVPILARLQLKDFYFEAGPQFGFILGGEMESVYELKKNSNIESIRTSINPRDKVEALDIGYIIGIGYQMQNGLGIGIKYNQGFKEVMRGVNWQKNVLLQASISYLFKYSALIDKSNRISSEIKSKQEEYYDPKHSDKKIPPYRIVSKQNVSKASVVKMGESARSEIQFVFNSIGSNTPSSILISGSSGVEVQSTLFTGFRDIEVPFKGVIRYSVQSSVGLGSIESNLELEINEPGIWKVNIMTQ